MVTINRGQNVKILFFSNHTFSLASKISEEPQFEARIVHGRNAHVPIPWHVGVGYGSGSNFKYLCGGTILDHKTILSSASCYNSSLKNDLYVLAGRNLIDSPDNHFAIKDVVFYGHDKYIHNSYKNNILLYKLKKSLPISPNINRICMPDIGYNYLKEGTSFECIISGWGKVTPGAFILLSSSR